MWLTGAFKIAHGMPLHRDLSWVGEAGSSAGCWGGDAGEREAGQVAAWGSDSVFMLPCWSFKSPFGKESAFRGVSPRKVRGQSRTSLMPALPREQRIRGPHIFGGSTPGGSKQPSSRQNHRKSC